MMSVVIESQSHITVVEAARRLRLSDETIRRWIRIGRLPAKKLGSQYFILEKDVESLIGPVLSRRG